MTATPHGSERAHDVISHHQHHVSSEGAESNRLLKLLPVSSYDRLLPHLERVEFSSGQTVWEANAPIRSVYFPRTCVFSLFILFDEDGPVESATIGREGMAGVPLALGADSTAAAAIAQVPGDAVRVPASVFRAALAQDAALAGVVLRYAHLLHEQTSQSLACNRRHSIDERCARWILMTHDRAGADQFALTQEFLALMLSVRRASVTVAAGILQRAGLIRYSRGKITIVDRGRLEEASCECYQIIREKFDQLLHVGGATHAAEQPLVTHP
jgi:CRP-like cAMP-binding protein